MPLQTLPSAPTDFDGEKSTRPLLGGFGGARWETNWTMDFTRKAAG